MRVFERYGEWKCSEPDIDQWILRPDWWLGAADQADKWSVSQSRDISIHWAEPSSVKTDNYTHSFLLRLVRESCGEIYYWIGRYFCIIFSLLFHQQDIFEESFVWKSNLGFQISTVSIVQWWWGFRMRSQRLWTANINMRIIESRLKCDKNESSWTFNQRLVSAKRILMFNPQSQL